LLSGRLIAADRAVDDVDLPVIRDTGAKASLIAADRAVLDPHRSSVVAPDVVQAAAAGLVVKIVIVIVITDGGSVEF